MTQNRKTKLSTYWVRTYREALLAMQENKCIYCKCELSLETSTLEHLLPLSRGGTDHFDNLAVACAPCNNKRGSWGWNPYGAGPITERELAPLLRLP